MTVFTMPFDWMRRASPYRVFWLGGPLLLYAWTLTGPFLVDDLNILLRAERYLRGESADLDLYRFAKSDEAWRALRDRGTCPWWLPESGRFDYFRPLTELAFLIDVRLFGRRVIGYRTVSLAVFVLVLLSVHWLFLKASGDPIRAGTASFLFGISQTAAPPVTWISNRQDLLVVLGVTLAAGAYWSARRSLPTSLRAHPGSFVAPPSRRWQHRRDAHAPSLLGCTPNKAWGLAAVAVVAYAGALLCKEIAVALGGVVAVHELILRRKPASRREQPVAGTIAILLVATMAAYLGYYLYSRPWVLDFSGADGSASQIGTRPHLALPLYAAVWTLGFPIDLLYQATPFQVNLVAVAACLFSLLAAFYLRRALRRDPGALFFFLWMILFMLPGLRALTTSTRTLCAATVGWCYLLAGLIVPARESDVVIPTIWRHWFYAANGIVTVGCVIGTVVFMNRAEKNARNRVAQALTSIDAPLREGDVLIVASAESSLEIMCAGDRLEFLTGRRDVALNYLIGPAIETTFEVQDEHTLLARSEGASLLGSPFHRLSMGPNWEAKVGKSFELKEFTAEVAEVGPGGEVTALRFRFREPLGSPRLHFYPPDLAAMPRSGGRSRTGQVDGS